MRTLRRVFQPLISLGMVVVAWYLVAGSGVVSTFLLPKPASVASRLIDSIGSGQIFVDSAITVYRTIAGFGLAVLIGSAVGLWMGRSRFGEWLLEPVVSIMFATPKISFLPIFILWFGTFDASKILMATFICAFPIISACHSGVKDVSRLLYWVAENIGMGERRIVWKIVLPATLPALLNGAQIALPFAFIAISVAEMMAGGGGIGARMMLAARFADSASVVASIVVLAVIGAALTAALELARRRILRWHTEVEPRAA